MMPIECSVSDGLHLTPQATRLVVRLLSEHAARIRAELEDSEGRAADLLNELGYVEAVHKAGVAKMVNAADLKSVHTAGSNPAAGTTSAPKTQEG